jgi:hypothetical protein
MSDVDEVRSLLTGFQLGERSDPKVLRKRKVEPFWNVSAAHGRIALLKASMTRGALIHVLLRKRKNIGKLRPSVYANIWGYEVCDRK